MKMTDLSRRRGFIRVLFVMSVAAVGYGSAACSHSHSHADDAALANDPEVPGTQLTQTALSSLAAWQYLVAADDPFASHRTGEGECTGGYGDEDGVLEVDTETCGYVTLKQDLLFDVHEGDCVAWEWWHLILSAPEPAEGHVLLQIGDEVVSEHTVPIPFPAKTYEDRMQITGHHAAGTPMYLHVHNHGANSWRFAEARIVSCDEVPAGGM